MKLFSKKMLQKWSFAKSGRNISLHEINTEQVSYLKQETFSNRVVSTDSPILDSSSQSKIGAKQNGIGRNANTANYIQISLASSDEIQNWAERSYFIGDQFIEIGEVKRPDTLNYRTFKPEKDGLFCERIFGPVNDWTCSCGQIKEQRFALDHERALLGKLKPKICPNCQVEVTSSRLRRYRMGYIALACPVTHIWYLNSRPSLFSILLKMPTKYIKKIAYYKAYSPSLLQIEYMSSCLGPGGDFFDNEWEYLHLWLAGKHSIEDIPSRTTQNIQKQKQKALKNFREGQKTSMNFNSLSSSRSGYSQVSNFDTPDRGLRDATFSGQSEWSLEDQEILNKVKKWGDWDSNQTVKSTVITGSNLSLTYSESIRKSEFPLSSKSTSLDQAQQVSQNRDEDQINFEINNDENTLQNSFNNIGRLNINRLFSTPFKLEKNTNSNAKLLRSKSIVGEYRKMPESPEWLLNTGAQALLNHLESRDWGKECEKIESELQAVALPVKTSAILHSVYPGRGSNPDTDFLSQDLFSKQNTSANEETTDLNSLEIDSLNFDGTKENDILMKRRKGRIRTLKLLKSFQKSGLPFSGMIFKNLPVLPPELRPIIQLGAGQLASSDVNDLYRRILSRNNRLKYYLYETHFVEFLVRSEQQLVQLAVDALIENGKTTSVRHTSGQKRLYKSLSDRIGGKQGRFRLNLLGKRVDYSGRSVIVVGPRLKLFQCGLPYEMAIELFQPFLLRHMLELQLAKTIRAAKNILRFNKPLARQLLHHVVKAHPILLNRAPTLHRLGIQAFQPVLVFGRAIHLHPLVCPAFNADFDGDQMAVHVPLSPQARIEARLLMLASGNWISSSTGQPNVLPSQDMVLGFYYLTIEKYAYQKGRGLVFSTLNDVLQAYELGSIDLHSQIWLKWYGPFTGDSNSRLTNPQKHEKRALESIIPRFVDGVIQQNPKNSNLSTEGNKTLVAKNNSSSIQKQFQNSIYRFKREADQPIEIRINKNGIATKIYSSYQWQQDAEGKYRGAYIRTTPGRVLMNQIFQTFA